MGFKNKLQHFFLTSFVVKILHQIKIPGLRGFSLFEMLYIYISGVIQGALTDRAAAISWSLFFSIFPFILFIFALLPYVPHYTELEEYIFGYALNSAFPEDVAESLGDSISQIIKNRDYTIFNPSIILAIFFTTNGINALINGFYNTARDVYVERNPIVQYLISLVFTLVSSVFILLSLLGIYLYLLLLSH